MISSARCCTFCKYILTDCTCVLFLKICVGSKTVCLLLGW